ncbi:uncharacterized protein LOC129588062, partial [Paramacrobiotus metropolitanus]|uniref:uncharacterized protein LOC129588062 n=1 Tax=Paramacrobiotus metropolitanus TaxID=2943436 RepID=UPI002445DAD5
FAPELVAPISVHDVTTTPAEPTVTPPRPVDERIEHRVTPKDETVEFFISKDVLPGNYIGAVATLSSSHIPDGQSTNVKGITVFDSETSEFSGRIGISNAFEIIYPGGRFLPVRISGRREQPVQNLSTLIVTDHEKLGDKLLSVSSVRHSLGIIHRNGPKDSFFETVTEIIADRTSDASINLSILDEEEPFRISHNVLNIPDSLQESTAEILVPEDEYLHSAPISFNWKKTLHRTGPKDTFFESLTALVPEKITFPEDGTVVPFTVAPESVLVERSPLQPLPSFEVTLVDESGTLHAPLEHLPSLEDSTSSMNLSGWTTLSRVSSSSRISIRTSIFAAEEESTDMLAADVNSSTEILSPRILSRGSSRASYVIPSPVPQERLSSEALRQYLETEAGTIEKWLQDAQETDSMQYAEEEENVQTITSTVTTTIQSISTDDFETISTMTVQSERSNVFSSTDSLRTVSFDPEEESETVIVTSTYEMREEVTEEFSMPRLSETATGTFVRPLEMPVLPTRNISVLSSENKASTRTATTTTTVHEEHSCLIAYRYRYDIAIRKLRSLKNMVVNPEVQYIDPDVLETERERFAYLLDRLIRTNGELGRLDDLFRAILVVAPDIDLRLFEEEHKQLNALYMHLLTYIRKVLRREKYLRKLLEDYQKERMEFKMDLLDQLTYLRTNEQSEEEQQIRFAAVLERAMYIKYATYQIMVRSTPEFAAKLEEEVVETLLMLRDELADHAGIDSGSVVEHIMRAREVEYFERHQAIVIRTTTDGDNSETVMSTTSSSTSQLTILPAQPAQHPVWNAVRKALPMQTLALVLIGFASLIPMANDDYSCLFDNYFASSSMNPMVQFQGTPPF